MSPFELIERDVREFMLNAGQSCPLTPTMPGPAVCQLRTDLIHEELAELEDSLGDGDLVAAYDAILDLLVVTVGTAVAMGLKLQPGWEEVHRSNMTKFIDGHKREDGKSVKGPSWSPPNLQPIIDTLKGGAK